MKKIFTTLTILLIASIIYAQAGLDTVMVRNIQLKGEEWWWGIKGINAENLDSLQSKWYNKLVKALKDANLNSSTNFTYDSLPGPFAMIFYTDYWKNPEARENMGQGIDTKLLAYDPLDPYTNQAIIDRLAKFNQRKNNGKFKTN